MNEDGQNAEKEMHKRLAVELYNLTYQLMDKKDRTRQEDYTMIHAAHASRYHWGVVGTPVHFERGEWQISRVYAVLRDPVGALRHAKRCLEICQENNIGDWDIAFAYEAMARALLIGGKRAESEKYLMMAKEAGERIQAKEDKEIFLSEFENLPA